MKRIFIAFFALVGATPLAAQTPIQVIVPFVGPPAPNPSRVHVDLGKPGALERLQQEDPLRYEKVAAVLKAAESPPCDSDDLRLLRARHELRDLHCHLLVMTSLPAKRHVSFVIEGTYYSSRVAMTYDPGRVSRVNEHR